MGTIQQTIWQARILLEIRLAASESRIFDQSDSYMVTVPRLSYLPTLLPKLFKFYQDELIADTETLSADNGQFSYEGVPLKWHMPVGLLYDIYVLSVQEVMTNEKEMLVISEDNVRPFSLTVHFSSLNTEEKLLISPDPSTVHDSFINSVKEADFVRSGTAKPIMSLSAAESKSLWTAVQENNLNLFAPIYQKLLPDNKPWRNIPLRIFLPSVSPNNGEEADEDADTNTTDVVPTQGSIRVIQTQIGPHLSQAVTGTSQLRAQSAGQGSPQTLGTALHAILPTLFPSRRTPILAKPLLHGSILPMNAVLAEVASQACYADGWVNVVVVINS